MRIFGHIHVGRGALQKPYEEVSARLTGWSGLVSLVRWKMVAWFWGSRPGSATIMVNAASVGGLIDDQEAGGRSRSKYEVLAVDLSCL